MQPNNTAEQIKARLAEMQGRETYDPNIPLTSPRVNPGNQPAMDSNPLIAALTERLTNQASGISTSSSSNLQNSINEAIAGTQMAGELSRQRLESERQRELGFARDRQGAQLTGALENRRGYATQVVALRELTETTEKEIKDLDQRYQEMIMAGDAATAQRVADLQMQKLEFLQEQEQQFYNNLISVANLQQEALQMAQQNEQFIRAQEQQERQFRDELKQSQYEFDRNYGLELDMMDIRERELDIQLERNQIAWAEYNQKKSEIVAEKNNINLQAIIAQDMKNQIAKGVSLDELLGTDYMARMFETTGFEGSSEEMATLIRSAYSTVNSLIEAEEDIGTDGRPASLSRNTFTNETTARARGNLPGFVELAPDGFLPFNF